MTSNYSVRVYTDGSCAFCWWARRLVEPYDSNGRLEFLDFNDPALAAETPFSKQELLHEMHVLTPDARWHAGFWGWIAILRVLPKWRWMALLLSLPPFRWLGPPTYRLLAANRYLIPEWLLRLLGAPRACATECAIPNRAETPESTRG